MGRLREAKGHGNQGDWASARPMPEWLRKQETAEYAEHNRAVDDAKFKGGSSKAARKKRLQRERRRG